MVHKSYIREKAYGIYKTKQLLQNGWSVDSIIHKIEEYAKEDYVKYGIYKSPTEYYKEFEKIIASKFETYEEFLNQDYWDSDYMKEILSEEDYALYIIDLYGLRTNFVTHQI